MRFFISIILLLTWYLMPACSSSTDEVEDCINEGCRLMSEESDHNAAAGLMLRALSLQNEHVPTKQLVRTYYYLSQIYWRLDFPNKALDFAQLSLSCAEQMGDQYPNRLNLINRVASCYYLALVPHHNDSAICYYNRLLEESLACSDSSMACNACNNMGAVYLSTKEHAREALGYFERSKIFSLNRDKDNFYYHYNCSRAYQQLELWDSCIYEINECMKYVQDGDIEGKEKLFARLYKCQKHLANYKEACTWADSSFFYSDSLYVERRREELKDLTEKYQREKYESELQLQRTHWVLAVVVVVFISLILFVVVMYRNKRRIIALQQKMEKLKLQISREVEQTEPSSASNENLTDLYHQQFLVARDLFRSRQVSNKLSQLKYHTDKIYLSDEERLPLIDGVTEVFIDPLQNLRTNFPELTADECLYAVLCFVGCSNSDISMLTKTTEATLRKRRSRFKQKTNDTVFKLLMDSAS